MSQAIILSSRFCRQELGAHATTIQQRILELFIKFYEGNKSFVFSERKEATSLEIINILLAIEDMGIDYDLPVAEIELIFDISNMKLTYFEIISCLYYIKEKSIYSSINTKIENIIKVKLLNMADVQEDSEKAHILLDVLSCKYLRRAFRSDILTKLRSDMNVDLSHLGTLDDQLERLEEMPWFVNWQNIDLLSLLEKRELSLAY